MCVWGGRGKEHISTFHTKALTEYYLVCKMFEFILSKRTELFVGSLYQDRCTTFCRKEFDFRTMRDFFLFHNLAALLLTSLKSMQKLNAGN